MAQFNAICGAARGPKVGWKKIRIVGFILYLLPAIFNVCSFEDKY